MSLVIEPHVNSFLRCNIWHLSGRDRDLVVDAGMGVHPLRVGVPQLFEREPALFLTHAHLDHIGGAHEFDTTYAHAAERAETPARGTLHRDRLIDDLGIEATHYVDEMPALMVDALPTANYDVDAYAVRAPRACATVGDGDTFDLGDRTLTALHLPGHSPGSIALFDPAEGVLFSGDVVYDVDPGEHLLDDINGASIPDYIDSLDRVADLPVTVVYPGHGEPFGRERLLTLIRDYLESRGEIIR